MKPIHILLFVLTVGIFYTLVQKYKPNKLSYLQKSKEVIQQIIDKIPKKMQKIIIKSTDLSPSGLIKLASVVAQTQTGNKSKEDKMLETFEDIKDIRYGKIGGSNIKDGISINKWIKVSSFTLSGSWDPRGFTLEVYPRIRSISSSRQTLVCLVRNTDTDLDAPYISLNTHNESDPNTRLIKDVKVVRVSGSGTSNNKIEVWIQFAHNWADTSYVMYFLYNFKTKDFIATVPQAMTDSPSGGQSWDISERIEPQNGKGNIQINGQINTMGKTNYPAGWGGGVRTWDVYSSATIGVGDEAGNVKGYFNSSGDASFSRNTYVGGALSVQGGANLEGKIRFRRIGANGDDNTDPYHLEKIQTSSDVNSLRLTINDNADESFQIWGNACGAGDCGGAGMMQHSFVANGDAYHKGQLCIGNTCMNENDLKNFKRTATIMPSGYINIVNRRPLFGIGTKRLNDGYFAGYNIQRLDPNITYGPFGYNVPPIPAGAIRKFRIYAVYTDTITGGAGPVIRVSIFNGNWQEQGKYVDFKLPITWGGTEESHDAFSDILDDPKDGMHGHLYTYIPTNATTYASTPSVRWQYIELQTLDIYN